MVNILETLYVLTALALLAALIQLMRGHRATARRFAIAGAIGVVASLLLYWILASST